MSITKKKARKLLEEHSLRATAPRLAVLQILGKAKNALSHTEVLERLGETDWDPATIYRNLIKLRDAGVAPVVSRAEGIDRYMLASVGSDGHQHPHFLCDDCGQIACVPVEFNSPKPKDERWAASLQQAVIQLRGECPDCIDGAV